MSKYKDTLNMPMTAFEMRAFLNQKEPVFRQKWLDIDLYQKILNRNKSNQKYILHDGPPYANGKIHVGTAMNKILKDIIVRYKSMCGYYSPFIAGWDTHGLPIENKMLKEIFKSFEELSILDLRKKSKEYALSQLELQKQQFQQLQLLSDLKEMYITLNPDYEAKQLHLFHKMVKEKLIFQEFKPIYWSPTSQSALAENEIEYELHTSPSILVAFDIKSKTNNFDNTQLIIWTTTPWTLLANSGVAFSSNISYSLIRADDKNYVCSNSKIEELAQIIGWKNYSILQNVSSKDFLEMKYISPFSKKECQIIEGHHVTEESGSGLVHMAPLFGIDDYLLGKKHNLEMIMHVNDKGYIHDSFFAKVNNMFYLDANKDICDELKKTSHLLSLNFIKHKFPYDWRTKKPVMYRGTKQWFVSIDKIKNRLIDSLNGINFTPHWAHDRLKKMLESRSDWCISRQRSWGVPIIIFYDKNKTPILENEIFEHVIGLIEKHGSDVWYEKTVDELLPNKYKNLGFTKEKDIMDVWFDSGSSSFAGMPSNLLSPFELYLEGVDQFRGWFNSSLIASIVWNDKSPFKNLLTHGFVVDGKNEKMSKSKGNVIDPDDIIKTQGADILRLWVANSDFTNDVAISNLILSQINEYYRRIRNTIKFMLGNLFDYKYDDNIKLNGVHLLINEQWQRIYNEILDSYEKFDFKTIIKSINNFFVELSSFYFDIAKDTLYTDEPNSQERRMYQYNIYNILKMSLISLAPILPTTCEDAYYHFNIISKKESVHLEIFNKPYSIKTNYQKEWFEFFLLRDEIYKQIENLKKNKIIHRTNETLVTINSKDSFIKSIDLKSLLMVGKIIWGDELKCEKFHSSKCERCWNHFEDSQLENQLCLKCNDLLKKLMFKL